LVAKQKRDEMRSSQICMCLYVNIEDGTNHDEGIYLEYADPIHPAKLVVPFGPLLLIAF
jgi:hypothetical protein